MTQPSYVHSVTTEIISPLPQGVRPTAPSRDAAGRFATDTAFHELLDAIQHIAETAAHEAGIEPRMVGRDRFNDSRHDLGLTRRCPSAQALSRKFGCPLSLILEAALGDHDDANKVIHHGAGGWVQTAEGLPNDQVVWALRAAAFAIKRPPTSTEYDEWTREWDHARGALGAFIVPTPSAATMIARFGDWSAALEAAGAIESASEYRKLARRRSTADPCEQILDRCIDATGILPSRRYLEEWAKRSGVPVGKDLKPYGEAVKKCRALRDAAGKWTPAATTRADLAPPLPAQVTEDKNMRRRSGGHQTYWTRERILAALRDEYGAKHLDGRQPTDGHYRALARGRRELPSAETVRHAFGTIQSAFGAAGL